MMFYRSNGCRGTSDQRHQGPFCLGFIFRLMMNDRSVAIFSESFGRDLPTSVAVNTGRVDEKIAGNVFS